jgi:hypothetical protein
VVPVHKTQQPGQKKPALRICGDYSVTVNPQLEMHRQPMPRPEDLMQRLGGGHGFSKIDLADAYNQIKLAPESQRRLALSTHRGVLLQTRLPFGIKSAPGYFQEIMEQLTSDLPGVAVYLDDILVSGKDATDHLQNLQRLLQRLHDKGLRCRREKCRFAEASVDYLGHRLTKAGVQKGPKVNAVMAMQREGAKQPKAVTKDYQVGDAVYAIYYGPRQDRDPRWIPATVVKRRGSRIYEVKIHPNGPIWRRHWEQLRPRYSSAEDLEPGDVPTTPSGPDTTSPVAEPPSAIPTPPRMPRSNLPTPPEYGPGNPRRSQRQRKAPDRLSL